jgi:ribosomal protein S27AE
MGKPERERVLQPALRFKRWCPSCEDHFESARPEERSDCPKCKMTGFERLATMARWGFGPYGDLLPKERRPEKPPEDPKQGKLWEGA